MSADGPPLPGVGPDLAADLHAWSHDRVWDALVGAFAGDPGEMPVGAADRLAWLDEFSNRWDARRGRERDQSGDLPLSEHQREVVLAAADRLGMRSVNLPRYRHYDHVLALGGLLRACFVRPAYAAHLLRSGIVSAGSFVGLGGHRPFSDDERHLAERVGLVGVDSEFDALDAGVRAAFGLSEPTHEDGAVASTPGGSWTIREYDGSGLSVLVVAAPSSEPETRRANTADAYRYMAEEVVHLRPGQRLLAVTTPIYVTAQHAVAVASLGSRYGVTVDTVGTDPGLTDPRWAQDFSATRYLMEFRSAIRSLRALAD